MPSASRSMPAVTPRPRCEPMWTLTNRAPNVGALRSSWASMSIERSKDSGFDPARFTRYEAWIETGAMSSSRSRSRNAASSGGGSARRFQAVGLSVKICIALGADLVGAIDRLDHAGREGQVGTDPSAVGEHVAHRTTTRGVLGSAGPSSRPFVRLVPSRPLPCWRPVV